MENNQEPAIPYLIDKFKKRKLRKQAEKNELLKLQIEEAELYIKLVKLRKEANE